jgi:hypothetical protein
MSVTNNKKTMSSSPPRSSSAGAVSMAALLSLAKKNEEKIKSHLDLDGNKSSMNHGQQKIDNKRKLETSSELNTVDFTNNEKSKKNKKRKKNKAPKTFTDSNDVANDLDDDDEGQHDEKNDYPYPVVADDHCESPLEAYQDIKPLLDIFTKSLSKEPAQLSIYDPYFCEGSVVQRLSAVGFPNVYNRKEDFYQSIRLQATPEHDLLLTNPPYSTDHMEKLLQYCVHNNRRPYCLLIPNYVYTKEYFARIVSANGQHMFFISPNKRYLYTTPKVIIGCQSYLIELFSVGIFLRVLGVYYYRDVVSKKVAKLLLHFQPFGIVEISSEFQV